MSQDLIIGIAGAGGDGVISAGESLITAAALEGYHGIMTKSFGSQIRGGEASCRLRLATQPVLNPERPAGRGGGAQLGGFPAVWLGTPGRIRHHRDLRKQHRGRSRQSALGRGDAGSGVQRADHRDGRARTPAQTRRRTSW